MRRGMRLASLACACALSACSGGDTIGAQDPGTVSQEANLPPLAVTGTNVASGQSVPLNFTFEITFDQPIDFSSVNANTVRIHETLFGQLAVGAFSLAAPNVLQFQPACPTNEDLSDAGLIPGGRYELLIAGRDTSPLTVLSARGAPIIEGTLVMFSTPFSDDPAVLFVDTVAGPPGLVVRDAGSTLENATYIELGLDPTARTYFERNTGTGDVSLPVGFLAPINSYSRVEDRVAWILQLDQSIQPGAANLARIGVQYLDPNGAWVPLPSAAEIEDNCAPPGARVRVTVQGIFPQRSHVRAVLASGFSDLVGETLVGPLATVGAKTATSFDPGTMTFGADADEAFETFALSGDAAGSLEDTTTGLPLPRAKWGGGQLTATSFQGTGGPGGDFDWFIPPGTTFIFDTTQTTIVGGPGGAPTTTQVAINGVIDVRDFFVPASSRVIFVGPNPVTFLATGSFTVEGELSLGGRDNPGVLGLNTTNIPEPGAAGQAGGGDGGVASWMTAASTPRGGHGFGAFNVPDAGGQGGETSYHPFNKNDRRGAGGGGGGRAADIRYDFNGFLVRCQTLIGMDGEAGRGGGPNGTGAISQTSRAQGGALGDDPFVDADAGNDFYGPLVRVAGGVVEGELASPMPGTGGGAGGDAVRSDSFPLVPFTLGGDEKGAGGGGGAGSIHVMAVGPIVVGQDGRIEADGGNGGGGENTSFFDRVGGGSGAGSGGSIVLESLTSFEAAGFAQNAGPFYTDNPNLAVHSLRSISALGGQGGAGHDNHGGANESGQTLWRCDAIPVSHFDGIPNVPPSTSPCYTGLVDSGDPLGPVLGAGGDGAPGQIQIHVPDPSNLSFPQAFGQDVTPIFAPPPVGWENGTFVAHSRPTFGPRSMGQSKWISLGAARQNPAGGTDQVEAFFDGTGVLGEVPHAGGAVTLQAPLIGPDPIQTAPNLPYIDADLQTMVMDASSIAGLRDAFERNPNLAIAGTVRLSALTAPDPDRDFTIVSASYDPALDTLALTTDPADGTLTSFNPPGGASAAWIARSYQVSSKGARDALDDAASVFITFDATLADPSGAPDASQSLSASLGGTWADDAALLNAADWDFYRFRVEFDTGGAATPSLEFLRLPFRF
ncbi:MAG: hypothetical protein GY711_00960 [bacterium]|nr:hypothetical protein [bacterium]